MCEWLNSEIIMHDGLTFGQYSCTFTQVFMPYWNFLEYTKAVTLHCGKSGMDQGPTTSPIVQFHLWFLSVTKDSLFVFYFGWNGGIV